MKKHSKWGTQRGQILLIKAQDTEGNLQMTES